MNDKKKKIILIVLMIVVAVLLICGMIFIYTTVKEQPDGPGTSRPVSDTEGFNNTIIQAVHNRSEKNNYMISPYSLEVVLSMLREGASGNTLDELNKLVPERSIKDFDIKKRINVANALFIKNGVNVKKDFQDAMTTKFASEVLRDDFTTPKVINDWANKETYGMIPKVMEQIGDNFLFGLGNAVAIDVEWQSNFECYRTKLQKFTKEDGSKIDVAMMHQTYDGGAAYYKDSDATYVSIPYRGYDKNGKIDYEGTRLEFIGILPEDNVDDYITSFDFNDIEDIKNEMKTTSDSFNVRLSLPKFKYEYDEKNLMTIFTDDLGLKETFGPKPNFEKIADYDMSISDVIHKSFIDLGETGTKAAAVTVLKFMDNAVMMDPPEVVEVNFDKPFVYLIKDTDSEEILFFGVVYSPTEYKEGDVLCEEVDE